MKLRAALPVLVAMYVNSMAWCASAQQVCGQFETAPQATATYTYHDGMLRIIELPLDAFFDVSCDNYSLSAVLNSPIIGVDENGNEIFPTGLTYPLSVEAPWVEGVGYAGTLSNTQYNYQWTFNPRPDGAVDWNGTVEWFGGRFERTEISGVELVAVPEPAAGFCLVIGLLLIGVAQNSRKANPCKKRPAPLWEPALFE